MASHPRSSRRRWEENGQVVDMTEEAQSINVWSGRQRIVTGCGCGSQSNKRVAGPSRGPSRRLDVGLDRRGRRGCHRPFFASASAIGLCEHKSADDRPVDLLLASRFFRTRDSQHLPASRVTILQPSSPEDIDRRIARRTLVTTAVSSLRMNNESLLS